MIYLIECSKTNSCKIGYASNPENRLAQLQTGNPFALDLITAIEGDIPKEKEIHNLFKEFRLKGEWFIYDQKIKDYFNVDEEIKIYFEALDIFQRMEQSEIRVFSFLLQYANGTKFSVNKPIRLEISKQTDLNERTVYNTIKKLEDKKLIFKHETGAYQVNPRYAFKGSSLERNNQLKLIIELGCKDC